MKQNLIQLCLKCDKQQSLLGQRICLQCGGDVKIHNKLEKQRKASVSRETNSHRANALRLKRGAAYRKIMINRHKQSRSRIVQSLTDIEEFINNDLQDLTKLNN